MSTARSLPENTSIVMPRLICRSPAGEVEFCVRALGASSLNERPRATECGATVLMAAEDQFWGDRTAWIMDPEGHVWTLATRVEQTSAAERARRWNEILERAP